MKPVKTNLNSKSCEEPIGSNCVIVGDSIPGLDLCKNTDLTSYLKTIGSYYYELITSLTTVAGTPGPPGSPGATGAPGTVIDLSAIDFKCLVAPIIIGYTCSPYSDPISGNIVTFIPDTSAPNGIGYCKSCQPSGSGCFIITEVITLGGSPTPVSPVPITTPGVVLVTIVDVLNAMIAKLCKCCP